MRRTLIVLAAVVPLSACSPANAQLTPDICEIYADNAALVMSHHQSHVPLRDMLADLVDGSPVAPAMEALVYEAYKEDRYQSPRYRQEAVQRFQHQAHRTCLHVMQGQNQ